MMDLEMIVGRLQERGRQVQHIKGVLREMEARMARLADEGEVLLAHHRAAKGRLDELRREMRALAGGEHGLAALVEPGCR